MKLPEFRLKSCGACDKDWTRSKCEVEREREKSRLRLLGFWLGLNQDSGGRVWLWRLNGIREPTFTI